MVYEHLKVKPGTRATSQWANSIVDAIEKTYWLGKRGDPDTPFYRLYGYYGYFYYDLFVQGRRVIKDQDPINLYDIFEPAKQRITESINDAGITVYGQRVADFVGRVKMDEYGNLGVIISDPLDEYGNVKTRPYDPVLREIVKQEVENALNELNIPGLIGAKADEYTTKRILAELVDHVFRRGSGRLLSLVDFSLNNDYWGITEWDIRTVKVEGDVVSYGIVKGFDEGIWFPKGTESEYMLKVVVRANGTAKVRVPFRVPFMKPFVVFLNIYTKDYDMNVKPYIMLGGNPFDTRDKIDRYLRLPANKTGTFMLNYFNEMHHGLPEAVVEINNPNDSDAVVYVSCVIASEIPTYIKGYSILWGWEAEYELEINNETFSFGIPILLPPNAGEVAQIGIEYGIKGDGTNPLSIDVYLGYGGLKIISDSTESTDGKWSGKTFKVYNAKRGTWGLDYMPISVTLSTSGTGKLVKFIITLYGFGKEYTYSRWKYKAIPGGTTDTILDLSNDTKHICGGYLEIHSASDGRCVLYADTVEGEIKIFSCPRGQVCRYDIKGRYTYIKAENYGTEDAVVKGSLLISDSYLPR